MTIITVESAIKRLKDKEVWPFNDGDNDCLLIHENRFYGFYDAGGVTDNRGFDTANACIDDAHKQLDDAYSDTTLLTTDPKKLGDHLVAVLSGRQFIDRLYELIDYNEELFNDYGTWSVKSGI